jgi:hypothetical protein
MKLLSKKEVLVGIPAEEAQRDDAGEPSNAVLGYIHNFGSPKRNIPARPFMYPGIERARDRVVASLRRGLVAALSGNPGGVDVALNAAGLAAQNAIRRVISDKIPPDIAVSTKLGRLRKLAKYRTAAPADRRVQAEAWLERDFTPLIETGQLRNAITYVVRSK